jgi:hypothetical protein
MNTLVRPHRDRGLLAAAHRNDTIPPDPAHLLGRDLVTGVAGQPRVEHPGDRWMRSQHVRHPQGVLTVPVHPDGERLMPRNVSQASNGPATAPSRSAEGQSLAEPVVGHHHRAAHHVGVAAQVLGGRVDHHVRAERQRVLQVRRGEGVVHHQQRARVGAQRRHGGDVHDGQQRVGGRLHPHRAYRPLLQGMLNDLRVGHWHRLVTHLPGREHLVEEPVGPAVGVLRDEHMVAGAADGPQ